MPSYVRQYGFIPPEIIPRDYVLGSERATPVEVLQSDGQWDEYLSVDEIQAKNDIDTQNCTGYGTLNCLEILFKRKFGIETNFSERYVGIMANTDPKRGGNNPQKVIETIRTVSGLINESFLPYDDSIDTLEEYYSPKPMTSDLLRKGKQWLTEYILKHEWVYVGKQSIEKIKEALTHSPLGVSVYAWVQKGDGSELYIKPKGAKDTHWTTLYGYVENKYWKIFDSYDNTRKKLAWDYKFDYCKKFWLGITGKRKRDLIDQLIELLQRMYANIKKGLGKR
jgi:hypothetical protein